MATIRTLLDLSEVRGQEAAKRALEISAAGGHHLLLIGPPGAGKTSLARAVPSILAPLASDVRQELAVLYGLVGEEPPATAPVRAPDPGMSRSEMVGRRKSARPGEASLATGGILLLDDLQDFRAEVLASLKEPMATGRISLSSPGRRVEFPARFVLIATAEPCPCGHRGDRQKDCRCTPAAIRRHWKRITDAFLDRLDLLVEVPALELGELRAPRGEKGEAVRQRVREARSRQLERTGGRANGELRLAESRERVRLDGPGTKLLETAFMRLGLSARGRDSIIRVARTIADLAGSEEVRAPHVAEAIQYRSTSRAGPP